MSEALALEAARATRVEPGQVATAARDLIDRAEAALELAPVRAVRRPGGLAVHLHTHLPGYAEAAARGLADVTGTDAGSEIRVLVATSGHFPGLVTPHWCARYFQTRDVEAELRATPFRCNYFPDLGFWQLYDRERRLGLQVMARDDGYPPWDLSSPLRNFIHWALARGGRGLVHAGTLAVDGVGVMLAGAGGSGKSGTVLSGVAAGLETVGDDYVLAEINAEAVRARPLFTTMKQDPEGLARLRLGALTAARGLNWQGKAEFAVDDVRRGALTDQVEIRAILVPEVARAHQTTVEPAGAKEAFLALAPSGVSQVPGDRENTFALCGALSRRLPAYRLKLGLCPNEVAARVAELIGKLCQ